MQVDVPSQPSATADYTQSKSEVSTESLESRKLAYIRLANGAQPRSPSSVSSFRTGYMANCDRSFLPLPFSLS
jgi:hypothetical protein